MAEGKAKAWTDEEKLGILFQIIEKMGVSIPWDDLDLPPGRTRKAVQVMVDREKSKLKKARGQSIADADDAAGNDADTETPNKKQRKAGGGTTDTPKKTTRTPRKKKLAVATNEDEGDGDEDGAPSSAVKNEEGGEAENPST